MSSCQSQKAPRRRPARVGKTLPALHRPFTYQPGGGFAKKLFASTLPASSPALAATPEQPPATHPAEPGCLLASAGTSLAPSPGACRDGRESMSETFFLGRSPGCCPKKGHHKGGRWSGKRHPEPRLQGLTAGGGDSCPGHHEGLDGSHAAPPCSQLGVAAGTEQAAPAVRRKESPASSKMQG